MAYLPTGRESLFEESTMFRSAVLAASAAIGLAPWAALSQSTTPRADPPPPEIRTSVNPNPPPPGTVLLGFQFMMEPGPGNS